MNTAKNRGVFIKFSALLIWLVVWNAHGQNTALYYKGSLSDSGTPANGLYDFKFTLFDQSATGIQQGPIVTNLGLGVTNGIFNTTLDFGGAFSGNARWLDVAVISNGGSNFISLIPRQEVFPIPYALYAQAVGTVTGQIAISNLPSGVALLSGNQTFTGTITAPSFSGSLTSNSVVPDSALSADVNLGTSANSQNNIRAYPTLNTGTYSRVPWISYDSDFDQTVACSPTAAGLSNIITQWATNGMLAAGYNLICLDDGWEVVSRPVTSQAMPYNTNNFPNGIAPVVAFAHQNGFQFMLYFSEGPASCCGLASTSGHETADCNEAASWGVDWIKVDFCYGGQNTEATQILWESAIYKTGRPISLMMSIKNSGDNLSYGSELNDWEYGGQTVLHNNGSSFFSDLVYMIGQATDTTNGVLGWPQQQSPGHYGDVGILEVNPAGAPYNCTPNQIRQAINAFAILASPYQLDGTPAAESMTVITNTDVISIFKDPLCLRGQVVYSSNSLEIIYKPLQNGAAAVALINNNITNTLITVNWSEIGISPSKSALVHDPNTHVDLGFFMNGFSEMVSAQDLALLIITPQQGSVAASTISGNISVTNFNGGTNANAGTVLAGNGQWIDATTLGNPNAITNNDTHSVTLNGPVTFNGSVTFASSTNASATASLNTVVATYSVTNVSAFNSGPLFTPTTGLYEVVMAATLTNPSTTAGLLQVNVQFANSVGTNQATTISGFNLAASAGTNVSFTGAYEMTGASPFSLSSVLTGTPTNQMFNVRCSVIKLQ